MKFIKSKITLLVILIATILVIVGTSCLMSYLNGLPKAVKSNRKLNYLYSREESESWIYDFIYALCFPYNLLGNTSNDIGYSGHWESSDLDSFLHSGNSSIAGTSSSGSSNLNSSIKSDGNNLDYSTTNVQVENVDEADIIKTDGQYIYSLSDNKVIITEAIDENNPKVICEVKSDTGYAPDDILVYNNYLIVINTSGQRDNYDMQVVIYDISDKTNPVEKKSFETYQTYYSSRMIDGKLYVISNGELKQNSDDDVVAYYREDSSRVDMDLNKLYYFKDQSVEYETIIAYFDLNNIEGNLNVQAFLSDVDDIYVSEKNIYLADRKYKGSSSLLNEIGKIMGVKGIWNIDEIKLNSYNYVTSIIKLKIKDDGTIKYVGKNEFEGEIINQFSLDEYESNLRVAYQNKDNGSKIAIFNDKMKLIGETKYVAEGEDMYSSRFIGDRAYFVTFENMDPLFAFDLSDPTSPKMMGELKIPGYSTYLHPYDENHLIGIGIETKEIVHRNGQGKVISTSIYADGMKMSLFDITDIENPKQISSIVIGDSRIKSTILSNHKALLFSKEKGIIAIPVTNLAEETEIQVTNTSDISGLVSKYNSSIKNYISQGYIVYDISVEEGFVEKGVITHDSDQTSSYSSSQALRGVYIKDTLFTVSQHMLKVNNLNTLEEITSIQI